MSNFILLECVWWICCQSNREDYRTVDNRTNMLGNVVKSPSGTFGFVGIEKIYFQQPAHLNTIMTTTYTPFLTNAADILPANLIIA